MALETYSPKFAPHVTGTYERKVDEDGRPERIEVALTCSTCGDRCAVPCYAGAPRTKVLAYAMNHVHADPMAVPERKKRE